MTVCPIVPSGIRDGFHADRFGMSPKGGDARFGDPMPRCATRRVIHADRGMWSRR